MIKFGYYRFFFVYMVVLYKGERRKVLGGFLAGQCKS